MAIDYRVSDIALARRYVDWGAIWGGVFCFMAIWVVFETLGFAIFATVASPRAAGFGVGMGFAIWSVGLGIIAMFVAGRLAGRGAATRSDGMLHGLILFGLSIVCLAVLLALGGTAVGAAAAGANAASGNAALGAGSTPMTPGAASSVLHNPYMVNLMASLGWGGFIALFLGWLAALFGGASGVAPRIVEQREVREFRPAA